MLRSILALERGHGGDPRDVEVCHVMSDDVKLAGGAPPRPATAPDLIALIQEASGLLKLLDRKGQYSSVDDWLAKAETALEALRARPVPAITVQEVGHADPAGESPAHLPSPVPEGAEGAPRDPQETP